MSAIEVVRLDSEALEVELLPGIGARLHRLRAFGVDLLRTPDDPATHAADPFFWGAYVMAPWTNRASTGPTTVAGRTVDLPANFDDGSAIHGQVYAAPWRRTGAASFAVAHEGGGWPWAYEVLADVTLAGPRLRLGYRLVNRSDAPMPGGLGLHPWWLRPVEVGMEARAVHPRNGDLDADPVAPSGRFALRAGREPERGLDATWLDVAPPEVALRWQAHGIAATLRIRTDGRAPHVAVATPDDPDAVALEPVTHVPWALDRSASGRPGGLPLVDPGGSLALDVELAMERLP